MAQNMKSYQQQEQTQVLSPRMMQSLNVLQMPSTELYDYLTAEVEANPVISFDSIDLAERRRHSIKHKYSNSENSGIAERYTEDESIAPGVSLRLQLSMLNPPYEVEHLGIFLIGMLDENGYFSREEVDRLGDMMTSSKKHISEAIELIQSLEPAGVGAFTLRECILLQLERRGLQKSDAWIVADNYLDLLGKNQLPQIARTSGMPLNRVVAAQQLIRTLNPKPLMSEARAEDIEYITPDIIILKAGKGYAVELNQLAPENICIDSVYTKLMRETDSPKVRDYLSQNFRKASWLRDSIRQRCETLMDCATELLRWQRSFFDYGPSSLKPYSRREMAEQLGRSESTVSRAFKDKYIECDWGIFPSDFFFPKQTAFAQSDVAKPVVEVAIGEIIDAEDRLHPLSDAAIEQKLSERGISVSRRTVAKYRSALGIPAAGQRKSF